MGRLEGIVIVMLVLTYSHILWVEFPRKLFDRLCCCSVPFTAYMAIARMNLYALNQLRLQKTWENDIMNTLKEQGDEWRFGRHVLQFKALDLRLGLRTAHTND